ncbi:MAG: hypothetical protein ACO3OC_10275 [Ilumatobacteraceae bacterium]
MPPVEAGGDAFEEQTPAPTSEPVDPIRVDDDPDLGRRLDAPEGDLPEAALDEHVPRIGPEDEADLGEVDRPALVPVHREDPPALGPEEVAPGRSEGH